MSIRFSQYANRLTRSSGSWPQSLYNFTICGFVKLQTPPVSATSAIIYYLQGTNGISNTGNLVNVDSSSQVGGESDWGASLAPVAGSFIAGGATGSNWFFLAFRGTGSGADGMKISFRPVGSGSMNTVNLAYNSSITSIESLLLGSPFVEGSYGIYGFDGYYAHIKIFDRALSDAELLVESSQASPSASNLISYNSFVGTDINAALQPTSGTGSWSIFSGGVLPSMSNDNPVFGSVLYGSDILPSVAPPPPPVSPPPVSPPPVSPPPVSPPPASPPPVSGPQTFELINNTDTNIQVLKIVFDTDPKILSIVDLTEFGGPSNFQLTEFIPPNNQSGIITALGTKNLILNYSYQSGSSGIRQSNVVVWATGQLTSSIKNNITVSIAPPPASPPPVSPPPVSPPPSGSPTLSNLSVSNIGQDTATLSVDVGGTLPLDALVQIQITTDPNNGPWNTSPRPTSASLGTFTWNATGLTSDITYYYRAFIYAEPGGGQPAVVYSSTTNSTFFIPTNQTELVLAIGDSLTNGGDLTNPYWSWRGRFQELMTQNNRAYDMIGPNSGGIGGGLDQNHASWGGAAIDASTSPNNIDSRLPTIFTSQTNPTLIILYIGWNEMWSATTSATAATRWTTLFNKIRSLRPDAKIIVCTLTTPVDGSRISDQILLNNTIRSTATANPSSVICADLDQLTLTSVDYHDYLHYSQAGAAKVAQRIFDTLISATIAQPNAVNEMVAQMGPNPAGAAPVLLPLGAGWSGGGAVTKGGDLRAVAVPSWWPGDTLASSYPWWDFLFPWHEVWDRSGHVDGLNARVAIMWLELWVLYDDVSGWQRLAREEGPSGGEYYVRAAGGSAARGTRRTESDGSYSVTVVPNGAMFHGWGAAAQSRGEHILAIHTRMATRLILGNPAGPDDRALAKYSVHVGCDPYPRGGQVLGNQILPYNPGNGCSRWETVTNDVRINYFTTLAAPPTYSLDTSYAYSFRQTISEAAFRANPPPPS